MHRDQRTCGFRFGRLQLVVHFGCSFFGARLSWCLDRYSALIRFFQLLNRLLYALIAMYFIQVCVADRRSRQQLAGLVARVQF